MLVEGQTFEMGWNPSNREWYIEKGYTYTNFFDKFMVKAEDLSPNSIVEVNLICDLCGTPKIETYGSYSKRTLKQGVKSDICNECKSLMMQLRNNLIVEVEVEDNKKIIIVKCEKCLLYKEIKCFNTTPMMGKNVRNPHCTECNIIDKYKMPENISLNSITKSSRDMNLSVNITEDDYFGIVDYFKDRCALTNDKYYITEHFIPVSWGHGGTYVGNIYPLRENLNLSKSNKNPFNWYSRKKNEINNLEERKWNKLIKYLADHNGLTVAEFKIYVNWCEKNKRTKEEVLKDGEISSVDLWKLSKNKLLK